MLRRRILQLRLPGRDTASPDSAPALFGPLGWRTLFRNRPPAEIPHRRLWEILHFPLVFRGSRGEWGRRKAAEMTVLVAVGEERMGGGKAESSSPLSHSLVAPNREGLADLSRWKFRSHFGSGVNIPAQAKRPR